LIALGKGVRSVTPSGSRAADVSLSDVPGCREVDVHEQTGLLFPVDNADALAAAMEHLVRAPEIAGALWRGRQELVVENFAAEIIGRQIVQLYRWLMLA
jgi:glycosyltransferase involved in cell wall biosynthesis